MLLLEQGHERAVHRKRLRRLKYFEKQKSLQHELNDYACDILHSANFQSSQKNMQHGTVSVREHSMNVARTSLMLAETLHIPCDRRDLARGALLHDYFLYDWHKEDKDHPHKLHGFYHPGTALRNAEKEYELNGRQRDIIRKHMWPLTVKPPVYKESWIVTTADKYCSLLETLHMQKGSHGSGHR